VEALGRLNCCRWKPSITR